MDAPLKDMKVIFEYEKAIYQGFWLYSKEYSKDSASPLRWYA